MRLWNNSLNSGKFLKCKNCKHYSFPLHDGWGVCEYFDEGFEPEEFHRYKLYEKESACILVYRFAEDDPPSAHLVVHENFFCASFEPKSEG